MTYRVEISRNPRRGVVLIATLASLILVMGLITLLQARSLAATKVMKRLANNHQLALDHSSVREMLRPLVGEAMIRFDEETTLRLNSTPLRVEFDGATYEITAQDPGGLVDLYRTPPSVADLLLTSPQLRELQAMKAVEARGLPLRQLAAQVGLAEAPTWLTTRSRERRVNAVTLAEFYPNGAEQVLVPRPDHRQPREVVLDIRKVAE
ncbi:hypothetical protein GO984_21910 [Rhodobacteraceae bacterium CY05]|uniref:Uncharacterized protein n=2 Tax=Parasedimentitalea huanghaiensis TaxID=2682100 RepID=A0A6L6WMC9_9RHOB|nr:hypothetical protein [Zongyanglinia huanghaiensis]